MAQFPYHCVVLTELAVQISELKEQVQSMCNASMSRNFSTFEEQEHMMYPCNQWPQNSCSPMYDPGWIDQPNFYWENNQSFESCDYN